MCHFPSVLINGDRMEPGLIHGMFLTTYPMDRAYRKFGNVYFDTNIKDVGGHMVQIFEHYGISHVSLLRNVIVEGRSWEMAAMQCIMGRSGVFSGIIEDVKHGKVMYGAVPGLKIKKMLFEKLITYKEISFDLLSR